VIADLPPPLDLLAHPQLREGIWTTVRLTFFGALLAAVCATAAGLAGLSRAWLVRLVVRVYVESFRGTSALVQLFWFYFALPSLTGIRLGAFVTGVLVLGLNVGAYGAEVVRGAILAVPRGQREAGVAIDLTRMQILRYVILPQALLRALPPAGNLLIELLKSTALVSTIAVTDLTRAALFLRDHTLRTLEIFAIVLVLYFAVASALTAGVRALERRLAHGQDYGGSVR